jgi:hypothetical protein
MKPFSFHSTFHFLFIPVFALLFLFSGCKKKPETAAADLPVHEQLMSLLQTSARKRCELSEARVNINQVNIEFASELKTHKAALAKIETELAAMRTAFKTAQSEKNTSITYEGTSYSEKNFRLFVEQKLRDKKNLETRIARYSAQSAVHADSIQKISLTLNELNSREEEAKSNISDILRGRQIAGIQTLLESVGNINVAAVTQAAKDIETPNTISSAAEAATTVKTTPQSTAETDAFLK